MLDAMNIAPIPLIGRFVRLEPLNADHKEGLRAALDCDPETWLIYPVNGRGEAFESLWQTLVKQFAYIVIRNADMRVVGMSSYFPDASGQSNVEIGATFLHADARACAVNPDMKRLMLAHAFTSGARRVGFKVDTRNARSQAAVLKLGATKEGVWRRERQTWTGHVRDTAQFSILESEWPEVRANLDARLAHFGG